MPKINNLAFGTIIVDGKKFNTDVAVSWDGEVIEREKSHLFSKKELMDLIMLKDPELVIVGTGTAGSVKIDPAAIEFAKSEGIRLLAFQNDKIVDEFDKHSRNKKVVAVIHITD